MIRNIITLLYSWKFSPRENFRQFCHLLSLANTLSANFNRGCTYTALAKIYSTEYFCSTKVAGLGEVFVQRKLLAIWYQEPVSGGRSWTPDGIIVMFMICSVAVTL